MAPRRAVPDVPGEQLERERFGGPGCQITLADVFGERFAGAALQREVLLHTEDMRKVLRRDYFHLCRMFNSIARTRGYPGVDPAAINRVERGVADSLRAARATIAARRAELAHRFDQHPGASVDVSHAKATRFQAPVASPYAMQFLDALVAADECIALSGAAWLQALVSPQEHHGLRRQLRRELAAVKAQATTTRNQCFRLRMEGPAGAAPAPAKEPVLAVS